MPRREVVLGLLTLTLLAGVAFAHPSFAAPANLAAILNDTAILTMLACGQMLVLLTRGVDLSVAANLALTGMIVALLSSAHPELGVPALLGLATAIGALLGALNGLLIWRLRVPPIVATLGTLSIYRGLAYLVSGGVWITSSRLSPSFLGFIRTHFLGLSVLSWLAIVLVAASFFFLRYTQTGRKLYAAGNNPSAAAYAGIDVGRLQCLAFILSGAIAGLCGYLWVSRFAVAYTYIAQGFELQVIAACVIGGVSITGGVGTVAGVLLGCLFLGVINNALPIIGISPFWQMAVSGLVIIAAVIANAQTQRPPPRRILERAQATP
jgi:rhamnose transport system permease protein